MRSLIVLGTATSSKGEVTLSFPIPNNPSYPAVTVYWQLAAISRGANRLNSNALKAMSHRIDRQ